MHIETFEYIVVIVLINKARKQAVNRYKATLQLLVKFWRHRATLVSWRTDDRQCPLYIPGGTLGS
jgi:hypothetical protein